MNKAEFWATKSPLAEYHAIVLDHPAFASPFRLVANQFEPVTLGGQVHTPAPMTIKPPDQKSDSRPTLTMTFPRQVVGRQFKAALREIAAAGSRDPISVTYSVYLGGDTTTPQITWPLYASDAGGISFREDTVSVSATLDNILRRQVSVIYDPAVFTGLEVL